MLHAACATLASDRRQHGMHTPLALTLTLTLTLPRRVALEREYEAELAEQPTAGE